MFFKDDRLGGGNTEDRLFTLRAKVENKLSLVGDFVGE